MTLQRFHIYRMLAMVPAGALGGFVGSAIAMLFDLSPETSSQAFFLGMFLGALGIFVLFGRFTVTCPQCQRPLTITRRMGIATGYWCDACERDPSAEPEEEKPLFTTSIYDSPPNPNHLPKTVARYAAMLGLVICFWYFNASEPPVDEDYLVFIWLAVLGSIWVVAWGITRELTARKCPECGGKLFYQKRSYGQKLGFRCRSCKHFIDLRSDYEREPPV